MIALIQRFSTLIVYIFILFSLTACTLGMGVATTGAQAVYSNHSIRNKLTDQYISMRSYRKIFTDTDRYKNCNISVAVQDSNVLLTGELLDEKFKPELTQLVKSIPEVNEVHNMLTVSAPSSALTRMSDSWLTTKIKSKLITAEELDPSQIKVVTENGTVFLMGTLFPDQADAAVDIARTTFGVQKVVKLFNYLHITKKA